LHELQLLVVPPPLKVPPSHSTQLVEAEFELDLLPSAQAEQEGLDEVEEMVPLAHGEQMVAPA